MTTSLIALLGFVAWTLLLIVVMVLYRGGAVLSFQKKADAWTRGRTVDQPAVMTRVAGAHANCLEMLPVFGAIVLVASIAGAADVTNAFALGLWFLAARVGQSVAHIISVHHLMIFFVRFPLFLAQLGILAYWLFVLFQQV